MFGLDGILGIIIALLQNAFFSGIFSFITDLLAGALGTATAGG